MRLSRPRAAVSLIAAAACVLTAVVAGGTAAPAGASSDGDRVLSRAMPAARALTQLDDVALARAASANHMSVSRLRALAGDRMVWMSSTGRLFSVDDFAGAKRDASPAGTGQAPPYPYAKTFKLHSLKTAQRTIYLDFTGHTVTGTDWNASTGVDPQNYPAYSIDGNTGAFSNAEKEQIQLTYQKIAEDYAPFKVDVTTEQPPAARIDRANAGDQVYGTRLLVTAAGTVYTQICNSQCGGVAYIDVFDQFGAGQNAHAYYQPGFVFTAGVGTGAKNIAEAASHEIGHNLALLHDGTSALGYYAGHGAWAPIMGVGYSHPVSQWSWGEYADANNGQNDTTVINNQGAPLRADDHGNTTGAATVLPASGKATGVITTRNDKDVFRFHSNGGSWKLSATPAPNGPNLDIQMRILNSGGGLVATINPAVSQTTVEKAAGLNAKITRNLPAGNYYLEIDGIGFGNPQNTGYSDYGSLGKFTVKVSH